ncbi:Germin-like protein subfamily 3 member 4 [Glycine soja]
MPGRSTMEAIYLIRRVMEQYRMDQQDLHLIFIDLEKAYDRVPREILWKALEKKGVSVAYIRAIQDMYDRVSTSVRTQGGESDDFPITIGLHQGSTLSPYLFTLILDVLTEQIQEIVSRCMLFADNIVLLEESREELNERLETWRRALETHGFRLSRSKSKYMECKFNKRRRVSNSEVKIGDHIIPQVTRFKYLGSVIQDDGEIEGDVNHRIQAGWMKWRKASGVLCDAKVPVKLKGKFYRTADKIRNEAIRERVGVAPIVEKMVENRLRWFGHVERRPVDSVVRRVDQMERRQTIRGRGRPKKTIREVIKKDLELNDLDRSMDPKEWPIIEALPSYGRGRERGYEEDILALYMEMALAMLSLQDYCPTIPPQKQTIFLNGFPSCENPNNTIAQDFKSMELSQSGSRDKQGEVVAAFLNTQNQLFQKNLRAGDVFVIPKGLFHFLLNRGAQVATVFSAFNSQNPGLGSLTSIPSDTLESVEKLKRKVISLSEVELNGVSDLTSAVLDIIHT